MRPERQRQVSEIYRAALEVDVENRAAFLDQECAGDGVLRREVESLIQSHEEATHLMAAPAPAVAAELLAEGEPDTLIGRTFARYKILSLLGAGGMGRVFLAEDAGLGRRVALKFLPEFFTNDKNQVQRFRQEARAASALNHPNILTVYEVGQVDGTEFIATEYVEGETLRARLTRGPFSVREALDVATQVADALVAAHQAGIVHRDVKPDNVMIRRDSYVKVLDFGLAKLAENQPGGSRAPTRPAIRTNPGTVMGTAEYMSPEQARGLPVDARTDVWSLGVVAYEMLTSKRPFEAATHGDTIVSILEREPVPLGRQVPEVPEELERIVTKALTKDREERYQTVKDMAVDLRLLRRRLEVEAEVERSAQREAGSHGTSDTSSADRRAAGETFVQAKARVSGTAETPATSSAEYLISEIKRHKRGVALLGTALVLLLASAGYGLYRFLSQPKPAAAPFQATKVTKVTATGRAQLAAISPDGKYVVYAEQDSGQQSLWVKQVVTGSSVQIVPPAVIRYWGLTFSPDGNYVYYVRYEKGVGPFNELYQVPTLGGPPRKLIERVDSAVTFSPDGQRLAFVRDSLKKEETSIVLANADGSGERTLATRKAPRRFASDVATRIAWSPDGKTIACPAGDGGVDAKGVVGVSIEDGSEKLLTSQRWRFVRQVAWLFDGSGLVVTAAEEGSTRSSTQLWRVTFPSGETHRITNDLNNYGDVSLAAGSGALVTVQRNRISNIWIAPKGDTSRAKQITSGTLDSGLVWTPNGKVVYWSESSGGADIWMVDADGSNPRQLTHEGENGRPRVSPDGRFLVFGSSRAGKMNIWRMDIDGTNEKQLTDGQSNANPYLSPDGRWLVYVSWDHGNGTLWKMPIDGGEPFRLSDPTANLPVVSPDGKQVACFYWDEQANPPRGAMILPFAGGPPTRRFDIGPHNGGFVLHWTPDSRFLLYVGALHSNIWSQPIDGGAPVQLTDFQGDQVFDFDYSPDDQWLAVARGRVTDDVVLISDSR